MLGVFSETEEIHLIFLLSKPALSERIPALLIMARDKAFRLILNRHHGATVSC